ncbi:DUF4262 domain-containing protein [Actinoplanes sp. CA-131856]
MADILQQQREIIDRAGWSVVHVFPSPDDPSACAPFTYTVGLTTHGHPELLLSGLRPDIAQSLLNDLARRVYDRSERFAHGQHLTDVLVGYDAVIVDGPPNDDLHPGVAFALYGDGKVRVQQLVWPDEHGRFPWQDGYGYPPHAQPLIGHP